MSSNGLPSTVDDALDTGRGLGATGLVGFSFFLVWLL